MLEDWIEEVNNIDLGEVIKESVLQFEDVILQMNKEQLDKGESSEGWHFSPYSAPYAKWRQKRGLQTANKDFKVTGEFRDDFYLLAFNKFYEVGSKNRKAEWLENKWSNDLYNLTDENKDRLLWEKGLADVIIDNFINRINGT
jgi:hypothetical protein